MHTADGVAIDAMVFDAVVFDMDGVLVDSEQVWDEVRRSVVRAHGGTWGAETTRALMGMSTPEWARHLAEECAVPLPPERIAELVIDAMAQRYAAGPPLLPGAVEVVRIVAGYVPVGIASSSPPALIDAVLAATGLADVVGVALSSEQVGAGKPAPDVYLAAADRLGVEAGRCAAVEDSTNGLRSALSAGMTVYAMPNEHFPPDPAVLAKASRVLDDITTLPAALGL